jgi:hypothetical protein
MSKYAWFIAAQHVFMSFPTRLESIPFNLLTRVKGEDPDKSMEVFSRAYSIGSEYGGSSPILPFPKKRPDLVEDCGGGGFCSSEAVGARLERME